LKPSEISGGFFVRVDEVMLWDRKEQGGFPEMKELKQIIRDHIAPKRDLGHSDSSGR